MIKVLVVDDSAVARVAIKRILESDSELKVIGFAVNGAEAVEKTIALRPDVITMDIYMPKLDGYEATEEIMRRRPTPIVAVSASVDLTEMKSSFKAVNAGALALVEKPVNVASDRYEQVKENLITKVKIMSAVKLVRRWLVHKKAEKLSLPASANKKGAAVIAIGSSTGGPAAVNLILKRLPKDFNVPLLIAQHITEGFGAAFAAWLSGECGRAVKVAVNQGRVKPGDIILAPDNQHLGITRGGCTILRSKVNYNHNRPSINYLFDQVAEAYGPKVIGVVLTGMGGDGAEGVKAIKKAGGQVIAQDEATSVVFGMPKAAINTGAVDKVVPIGKIASTILSLI